MACTAVVPYDHRPLHPCYAGTEHVEFSPTRKTLLGGAVILCPGGFGFCALAVILFYITLLQVCMGGFQEKRGGREGGRGVFIPW